MALSNQPIELDAPKSESLSRHAVSLILLGCAVMFSILNFGVTWLAGICDQTWAALATTAIMLAVAVLLKKLFFKHDAPQALRPGEKS